MDVLALIGFVLYLLVVLAGRAVVLRRRTGSAGWNGISGTPGSAEWWGGVLFAVALVVGLAAPLLAVLEVLDPVAALDGDAGRVAGTAIFSAGFALSLAVQRAMGRSWRIGVNAEETTALIRGGPFALVRNPFFSALLIAACGLTLMSPTPLAMAGLATLLLAIELQVRCVEEPYLLRTHGAVYRSYAGRVGRLAPGLGLLGDRADVEPASGVG